jgi:hypothetical protein
MKFYKLTNISKFDFQVIAKSIIGQPGFIYTIKAGQSIDLHEGQLSGDIQLKLKKKLLSSVETEKEIVVSTFRTEVIKPEREAVKTEVVELETKEKSPLSTRGRKKKTVTGV